MHKRIHPAGEESSQPVLSEEKHGKQRGVYRSNSKGGDQIGSKLNPA